MEGFDGVQKNEIPDSKECTELIDEQRKHQLGNHGEHYIYLH
jgi:hypothetical protein